MKADNKKTDHNRTILVTGIPQDPEDENCPLPELTININYAPGGGVKQAITLDKFIIPTIIGGINALEIIIEKALTAYVTSKRLTWKGLYGREAGKTFRKLKGEMEEERLLAKFYDDLLTDVFKWKGSLYELAQERKLLHPGERHPEDPERFRIQDLPAKSMKP